ncbi:alpha-L-fucosidase [Mucilaginibacter gossypii]|uniref:alpha-L-fucosidase n=1 Tax=Mucilaginibacter gossypii TaxID=551996 RepID=UPI000DCEF773|nr:MULTISPECIES: alpha-L-fucosidase [Mucilaginibacter]QTE37689.1 alpha-L-fucosidase [Mucilaginibacter gossypii]RAV54836.1 alpha-L-fucosidase [Mucilaginibacter rubeus]
MKKPAIILLYLFSVIKLSFAQQTASVKTPKAVLDDFMTKRFGMFIHFGPVTLRGTEIGWSRNKEVAQDDYDNLYKEFNPVLFNADAIVKAAKDAGMKYLVITAKHHDGFALWPSAFTDYNISKTPYKRDMVAELAAACKKQGILFCIYHTVLDWHDPNYPIQNPYDSTKNVKGDMVAFKTQMKNELKELITKYHPYLLWFDGYWEKPWTNADGQEIYKFIKDIDPNVIVNNRLGKGSEKLNDQSVGDYLTPEQRIGQLNMNEPWESCITICQQWAWKPNDKMKTVQECIQTLVKTAAGNGNLLFNVGPMPDGRIEARQVETLQQMGLWLKKYGESIYGTKGGPIAPNDNYAVTRKGNKIYLHIFQKKGNKIALPNLPDINITNAYVLGGAKVNYKPDATGYSIDLPQTLPDANSNVIVLELNKNAEEIPVIAAGK